MEGKQLLHINDVLEWLTLDANSLNRLERILWMDDEQIVTIDIDDDSGMPVTRFLDDIDSALATGVAKLTSLINRKLLKSEDEIKSKNRTRRDQAYEIILPLAEQVPDIFAESKRGPLIAEAAKKYGRSKQYIYNNLRRFWQGGMLRNALLPNYDKCGTPRAGLKNRRVTKKLGRPNRRTSDNPDSVGINITEEIRVKFELGYKLFCKGGRTKKSLRIAFDEMIKKFFNIGYEKKNGVRVPILPPDDKLPSYWQFKDWYTKHTNLLKTIIGRVGERTFNLTCRQITGDARREARGPGAIWQIDATIPKVHLVSKFDRSMVIGRPVVYGVIDVFSGEITGIHAAMEGPSWASAMVALFNAVTDKVTYCAKFGIDIAPEDWPCTGLPDALVADRGEFKADAPESLVQGLNVRLLNTPPYRADWKSFIERYFGIVKEQYIHWSPGVIVRDHRQRGEPDYRESAALTLEEFTQILINCVLEYNQTHFMADYPVDEQMIRDGVQTYPADIWNWGIGKRFSRLRNYPEDLLRLNLMPKGVGMVTPKGIRFKGLHYDCKLAQTENWFLAVRLKRRKQWPVTISYDPRDTKHVYLWLSDGRQFEMCHLLSRDVRFEDKSFEEVDVYLENRKVDKAVSPARVRKGFVKASEQNSAIIRKAKKETRRAIQARLGGNKADTKNVRTNRAVEAALMAAEEQANWQLGQPVQDSQCTSIVSAISPSDSPTNQATKRKLTMLQKLGHNKEEKIS